VADLADLHQARAPAGCWPAARPHLTVPGPVHPFRQRRGRPRAQGTRSCRPGQQVPHHRFAVDGASRSDLLSQYLPAFYLGSGRNLITVRRPTRISAGLCAGPPRAGHASLPLVVFRLEVCESWVPGSPVCVSERHWLMCLLCRPLQAPPQVDAATLSRQPVRCLRACVVLGRVRGGSEGTGG
jgi:hypothetical protein